MKTVLKYIISTLLCFAVLLPIVPEKHAQAYVYTDGYTVIGDVTIPFPEYMPGSYFTKDGTACICHNRNDINCVASGRYCNCLRFVNIDGVDVDLLAVQCIGFARYVFYKLFGFIDADHNSHLFYNAGSISSGKVTASSVKELVSKLKPGAHIRFNLTSTQHSVIVLNKNENGFTVYHANAGGNGISSNPCVVSTRTFTWEQFANFAYRGIVFAHMPNNYPDEYHYTELPSEEDRPTGTYVTTDNLNLREGAGTGFDALTVIPAGTAITVTEFYGNWAYTSYDGYNGWVSLNYINYAANLTPKVGSGIRVDDNGYVYGVMPSTLPTRLNSAFEDANISINCEESQFVGTGVVVRSSSGAWGVVVVYGDVNGDGILSSADCLGMKKALMGKTVLDGAFALAADFDNSGVLNTVDYKKLQLFLSVNQ